MTATDRRRGAEVFTERLGVGLEGHGWVVDMASLTRSGDARRVPIESLTDVDSSRPGRMNRRIGRALNQRIKAFQPDLVLANGGSTLRYAALATLRTKPPLVYIAIGEPDYWIRSGPARIANRWMLRRATRVFAVCEATARQLRVLEPSLAGRVDVTYTGVPDEMFRSRSGRDIGPLRVVMVGSLSEEKDPLLALRSVAAVPDAVIRFVGSGPLTDQVRSEAERLGVDERVEMVGAVDDVGTQLEWANVLLLTSRTEGLPAAILEAGASSVPAVAVDVGGVREAIVNEDTGIVVQGREAAALTTVLARLAADPDLVTRMGEAARAHVLDRFAMDRIISGYSDRLLEVLG
ncbi:MAG TPA: glycosyltransferase family 4 protein [Acidimicrobiia bacterium]